MNKQPLSDKPFNYTHMKFVHYLSKIEHIQVYALTAFGIFAAVFLFSLLQTILIKKSTLDYLSQLPLEQENQP
jgi:hypothetical protein